MLQLARMNGAHMHQMDWSSTRAPVRLEQLSSEPGIWSASPQALLYTSSHIGEAYFGLGHSLRKTARGRPSC